MFILRGNPNVRNDSARCSGVLRAVRVEASPPYHRPGERQGQTGAVAAQVPEMVRRRPTECKDEGEVVGPLSTETRGSARVYC